MSRLIFLGWLVFISLSSQAQTISLSKVLEASIRNNPVASNRELAAEVLNLRKSIIKAAWMPGIELNAQATWQSDVVSFTLDLPFPVDFPQIPRDQYKATLDFTQLVYDGGVSRNLGQIEEITSRIQSDEVGVRDQAIAEIVHDLYFSALILDKRIEILRIMVKTLESTSDQIRSGIRNGILSETDYASIQSEKVRWEQQMIQASSLRRKALESLSILSGIPVSSSDILQIPPAQSLPGLLPSRAELSVFSLQQQLLEARADLLSANLRPKVMAFGQAGYGKPGLNFLGDSWNPYAIIGLRMNWTFWDWNKTRNQKGILLLNQRLIENQVNAFTRQLSLESAGQLVSVSELESLLLKDMELIEHRSRVSAGFKSKLDNGLIPANLWLNEWTKEQEARLTMESHKIEKTAAEYRYLVINGKIL